MNKTLHDLYYGTYRAFDRTYHPQSEYGQAFSQLVKLEEELVRQLPEEMRKKYEELDYARMELASLDGERNFEYGFKLAVRLMQAASEPDSQLLPQMDGK